MTASELFDLSGRTALITGSSRGLGRALAASLAEAGAQVVVHGRDAAAVEGAVDELVRSGARATGAVFDLTDEAAVVDGVAAIVAQAGPIDVLVNNAGVQRRAPLVDFALADWEAVVGANLTSAFLMSRTVAASMIERGRGKIINIGSVQSRLGRPGITPYAATKGGIVMLTRGLCADLGPSGIQVNAIAPGYFATEMTRPLVEDEDFDAWVRARTPAGRWGVPEDLAGAVVFLAGPSSDFVNGQILYIDGGMTAVV